MKNGSGLVSSSNWPRLNLGTRMRPGHSANAGMESLPKVASEKACAGRQPSDGYIRAQSIEPATEWQLRKACRWTIRRIQTVARAYRIAKLIFGSLE